VLGSNGIQAFDAARAKARQRAALVAPHQAGVADNVSGHDSRQFALLTGHWNFSALMRPIAENAGPIGNQSEKSN
jgi:hypothetical protein